MGGLGNSIGIEFGIGIGIGIRKAIEGRWMMGRRMALGRRKRIKVGEKQLSLLSCV